MKSTTFLHYIWFTVDSSDRDYTKYPNPFQFVCENFSEYFKNIKVFPKLRYIGVLDDKTTETNITNWQIDKKGNKYIITLIIYHFRSY
jgi:hypothetical protein